MPYYSIIMTTPHASPRKSPRPTPRRSRLDILLAMIPTWSVSVPAGAPDHWAIPNGRYRHFSGPDAERRACAFADLHGLRLASGRGDRHGWIAIEAYLAELDGLVAVTDDEIRAGLQAGLLSSLVVHDALLRGGVSEVEVKAQAERLRARARCMQILRQCAAAEAGESSEAGAR